MVTPLVQPATVFIRIQKVELQFNTNAICNHGIPIEPAVRGSLNVVL